METEEKTEFAVLDKGPFQEIVQEAMKRKFDEGIKFFKQIPFIAELAKHTLMKLYLGFKERTVHKGSVIFEEGAPAETVYIVKSGELELHKSVKITNSDGKLATNYLRIATTEPLKLARKFFNPENCILFAPSKSPALEQGEYGFLPDVSHKTGLPLSKIVDGQMCGYEETSLKCPYRIYSCQVAQNSIDKAKIYEISAEDFFRYISREDAQFIEMMQQRSDQNAK